MRSAYSFNSITINGREIKLDHILTAVAEPLSPFEISTFSFIRSWFNEQDEYIQNTSGSTGIPKSIAIYRKQMVASAQLTQQALHLRAGETALVCLDTEYIAGKMMLVRSFTTDMKIVAVDPSANPFRDIQSDVPIDFAALVPFQVYEVISSKYAHRLNSVRNILVGGAALTHEAQKSLAQFTGHVYATYGMTETISHIALQAVNGPLASGYFKVLPGIKINTDLRGCLEITAPYLSEKIITNDIVQIQDEHHFKWLGRSDNLINTGGIKLIPERIEAEIGKLFDEVKIGNKFLISSLPDPKFGNKVILLVEGSLAFDSTDLYERLKKILAPYEVPKNIYDNVKFVFTQNGKIDRRKTVQMMHNQI
ncbi:AMP-binding protein [Chryseolinea sp. H1M3-3]|uniref:AMP-binding protein n=1 Tax=Chryseolinea sp. H1M3-3 TaxID=3034144 RepID=UPI0023ECFFA7|nr:AMP-binding protein [Chryseolinea sp. H1M3-3]